MDRISQTGASDLDRTVAHAFDRIVEGSKQTTGTAKPAIYHNQVMQTAALQLLEPEIRGDVFGRPKLETVELVRQLVDESEERPKRIEAERLAGEDPLTGLHNRRTGYLLMENMVLHMDRDYVGDELGICAVMLDVNFFKEINDTYGHEMGDRVLQKVAEHLKSFSRESDVAARWGGEEFLLVLDHISREDVRKKFGYSSDDPQRQDGPLAEQSAFLTKINELLSQELPEILELKGNPLKHPLFGTLAAGYGFMSADEYRDQRLSPHQAMSKLLKKSDDEMYITKNRMKATASEGA